MQEVPTPEMKNKEEEAVQKISYRAIQREIENIDKKDKNNKIENNSSENWKTEILKKLNFKKGYSEKSTCCGNNCNNCNMAQLIEKAGNSREDLLKLMITII